MAVVWDDELDAIFAGDLTVALGYRTPAGGIVVQAVAPIGRSGDWGSGRRRERRQQRPPYLMQMRVAVLNDIHGNLPALDAVLAEVDMAGVDAIVVGGDLVWGPMPGETLDRLVALGGRARFVMGNADRDVVEAFDGGAPEHDAVSSYCAGRISRSQRDFLAGLAPTVVLDVDGLGKTLFCHGSPRSDTERITTATPDARLRRILDGVEESLIVCGHTHRQFDRRIDRWRVVNAGAVGLPYEGRAAAFWTLLGPAVELRRTDYDVASALTEFRARGMPEHVEQELSPSLIEPVDPDEVAAYFERRADPGAPDA